MIPRFVGISHSGSLSAGLSATPCYSTLAVASCRLTRSTNRQRVVRLWRNLRSIDQNHFPTPEILMSTLLDEPRATSTFSPTQRLRATMAAVRVMFTWLGSRKTLTQEQKSQAADTFGAERAYLSAG